jgi:autotransporter-associated beta strand protein
LVVSAITPTVWTGATNGNWDTTTTNWLSGNTPVAYKQLASVLFNDAASNAAVTLNITATPSAMVVSNTALPYGFAGSGGIGGSLNLAKWGTNSLGLATANTFIGSLTIQGGILQMSNAAALGASSNPVYVTNSGTLDISGNGPALEPVIIAGGGANGGGALVNFGADQNNAYRNVTMTGDATVGGPGLIGLRTMADSDPGLIANGHNLTKVGTGQFNLNGGTTVAGLTNVWGTDLGNVDIKQGTFSFERRCALGLANNTITVEAGAILNVFSLNQTLPVPPNQIVMTNAGLQANAGTPGDVSTLDGAITLNGTNSISTIGGAVLDLDGSLVGSGGAVFNGSINLAGPNTFAGPTVVSNSTLVVAAGGTLAGSTNITVLPNATLDVSAVAPWTLGGSQTLDGYGTVNGSVVANGTVAPGTTIGTLTFNNDLTLSGTTVLALNKSLPGQTNDIIVVDGALAYGGALKVVVEGSTPLAVGDSFQLFSFASAPAGEFAATNLPAGYTWDASQLAATGTITVTGISNRPHPRFIAVTVSGHSIVLSGTNAVGTYVLYGTTNLLPANWVPVYTNTFAGSFSFTNTTGAQQQFYLLQ